MDRKAPFRPSGPVEGLLWVWSLGKQPLKPFGFRV